MALEQQQSADAQARYSPEEAGEILRRAANLQDSTFTVEQLRAIAREAGVADENLERAIEQHEQGRIQVAQEAQARLKRKRLLKWLGLAAAGFVLSVILGVVALAGFWVVATTPQSFEATTQTSYGLGDLLASSSSYAVYRVNALSSGQGHAQRVVIRSRFGDEYVVGAEFQRVSFASFAPYASRVALYDSATGEIWVVELSGQALQRIGRSGEPLVVGNQFVGTIAGGNPIVGWESDSASPRLRIRLDSGQVVDVPVRR